jgi:hypothetical protein
MKQSIPHQLIDSELAVMLAFTIRELRAKLDGELLVVGETGYEVLLRATLGNVYTTPGFIIRSVSADDTAIAKAFASRYELPLLICQQGAVLYGDCNMNDGVLIDLL